MMDEKINKNENENKEKTPSPKMNRRDVLKGLATIPVLGAVAYGVIKKERYSRLFKQNVQDAVNLSSQAPMMYTSPRTTPQVRIGVIGYGGRGEYLLRGAGFAHPDIIDEWKNAATSEQG